MKALSQYNFYIKFLIKVGLWGCLCGVPWLAHAEAITLTVAAFPAVDQIVKAALPQFNKKYPNIKVKVVSREFSDHHTAMTTAIATGSNMPDVMLLESSYMGRFADSGAFEVLSYSPYNALQYKSQFVSFSFPQASNAANELVAMPTDIGIGALFYRNDILLRAGVKEAELTQSWESFVQAGIAIKAATGSYLVGNARDLKDIIIRSNLKSGEGIYFDATGKVLVESPRFVRAFELARIVRQNKLEARTQAWSPEWAESFKRGTVATQMMGSWFGGHLANWLAPETKGLWRTAALPDGAFASWGGTFYAIPNKADHKMEAWELVKFMTLERDRQIEAFKTQDAFPALLVAHQDDYFNEPVLFLGGQKARILWRDLAAHTPPIPLNKLDALADEIINTELDKVMAGRKEIKLALADAAIMLQKRIRHSMRR
jgi:multiple sugar transport system substrate-binding protein